MKQSHLVYTDEQYKAVKKQLPLQIEKIEEMALQVMEPNFEEQSRARSLIMDFVRENDRIIYGGTALNAALVNLDPSAAIYNNVNVGDVEFYSVTPVDDINQICDLLLANGFADIQGKEANHEETYTVFANLKGYADITYCPSRILKRIQTINIDGIKYAHPHFMLIDYLRMFCDPLPSSWRWEKAFTRYSKLLQYYPIPVIHPPRNVVDTEGTEHDDIILKIYQILKDNPSYNEYTFITGLAAYYFYNTKAKSLLSQNGVKNQKAYDEIEKMYIDVPYLELISVRFKDSVLNIYNKLVSLTNYSEDLKIEEYVKFFQFTGRVVVITYKGIPVAKIYDMDSYCVVANESSGKSGIKYTTIDYVWMHLLVEKFRAHIDARDELEKNKIAYPPDKENYNIYFAKYDLHTKIISYLLRLREIILSNLNIDPINDTIFGQFKYNCSGYTMTQQRRVQIRVRCREGKGKKVKTYRYFPSREKEATKSVYKFENSSGNKEFNSKKLMFIVGSDMRLSNNDNLDTDEECELVSNALNPILDTEIDMSNISDFDNAEN